MVSQVTDSKGMVPADLLEIPIDGMSVEGAQRHGELACPAQSGTKADLIDIGKITPDRFDGYVVGGV